jgi:hypothetical protein
MRKTLTSLLVVFSLWSCDDGELEIQTIDFDEADIQACDSGINTNERKLLFKVIEEEALILEVAKGIMVNRNNSDEPSTSNINNGSSNDTHLTYRFFTTKPTNGYFCDPLPPADISVTNESVATGGTLTVRTAASSVSFTKKSFTHDLQMSNLNIENDLNENIIIDTEIDYGAYITTVDSSIEKKFDNFTNTQIQACDGANPPNKLFKKIDDEFLSISLPDGALDNVAGVDTYPLNATTVFTNSILNVLIPDDSTIPCSGATDANEVNSFSSTEGELTITTVANNDGGFNHVLVFKNMKLRDKNEGNVGSAIASYTFGTYTSN